MSYKQQKQYRLPGYDYSEPGEYFITICTKDRACVLATISKQEIHLSAIGEIASKFIGEITQRHPGIYLDEWVIMPNHIHLILMIENDGRNMHRRVPTGIQPLVKRSVSSVINHFKGNVKRWCNQNGLPEFAWQARYHDHIIRNSRSLERIRQYIRDNPLNWETDVDNA
jgi:REP element-mobilizing transposase RayT